MGGVSVSHQGEIEVRLSDNEGWGGAAVKFGKIYIWKFSNGWSERAAPLICNGGGEEAPSLIIGKHKKNNFYINFFFMKK